MYSLLLFHFVFSKKKKTYLLKKKNSWEEICVDIFKNTIVEIEMILVLCA